MPDSILVTIVVTGLATFVGTFFLKELDGPWRLFHHIRLWLKVYEEKFNDQTGEWYNLYGENFVASLFQCFWCLATWISAFICIITIITFKQPWYYWPFEWLATIAVAGLVYIYKS